MSYQVFIEGHEMDVDDKSVKIATTLQNFDFLNIGASVKANRTNRISLPLTNNNKQQLEQIAPLSVITTKPYRNLSIRIKNGIEILPVGVCQIMLTKDRIELDVQSDEKGFFDELNGKYLTDIDLSAYDGLWDDNRRHDVRNTSSGLVAPVTNNGQIIDSTTYVDLYTHGRGNIPFFYYKTIMEKLFALTSYSKSGSIFSDTNRYLKMAMSTGYKYHEAWLDTYKLFAWDFNQSASLAPNTGILVPWEVVRSSPGGWIADPIATEFFKTGTTAWGSGTDNSWMRCKFTVSGKISITPTGGSPVITVEYGVDGAASEVLTDGQVFEFSVEHNVSDLNALAVESLSYVRYFCSAAGAADITVDYSVYRIEPVNTSDTSLVQNNLSTWRWVWSKLMPRVTCKDFIKDFMTMFGLVMREVNGDVEFWTIEEILNSTPTSEELYKENRSDKPEISYQLSGFGQKNNHYWIVQDDELLLAEFYGSGFYVLNNLRLPESVDKYTSIFTASNQITEKQIISSAQIPIYNQGTSQFTKAASFGSRLIMLRDDDGVNARFKAGSSVTDYFIGYFLDKNQSYDLDLQDILDEYYPTYIDVLNRYVSVNQKYFLTLAEFCQMDLLTTKHKDGITYLVERVENYIPGQSANFKMIKI